MKNVIISGIGAYLPGEPIPINEIDDYLGEIPGYESSKYYKIIERFAGVKYRHYALEKNTGKLLEDSAQLSEKAALLALNRAKLDSSELDLIITTTSTPPYLRAGLAKEIRILLGIDNCTTLDLWGACTGVQQAITIATGLIRAGIHQNALIIGVELVSTSGRVENINIESLTREAILLRAALGDGAGAIVFTGRTNHKITEDDILYTCCGTEGKEGSAFHREGGGSSFPFNADTFSKGQHHWEHDFSRMLKKGRPYFLELVQRTIDKSQTSIDDIKYLIPAAANFNYMKYDKSILQDGLYTEDFIQKLEEKMYTNFYNVGNVPSAAVYLAFNELYEQKKINKGDLILLASIEGATWGWGTTLLRWNAE